MSGDRPAIWPRFKIGAHLWRGIGALALFVVLAYVFVSAPLAGEGEGFEQGASITASIGHAMFNLGGAEVASEGFLAAFEIIDVVLVAALVAAVLLARRDVGGRIAGALGREGDEE